MDFLLWPISFSLVLRYADLYILASKQQMALKKKKEELRLKVHFISDVK